MAAKAHSTLGASSAYRWWACPGSVALSATVPETSNEYAREGNAAHDLLEQCLKNKQDAIEYIDRSFKVAYRQGDEELEQEFIVDEDMAEAVQVCIDHVRKVLQPGDKMVVEYRFNLTKYHPKFFGTCDIAIYRPSAKKLFVIDYKHGRGVPVDVKDNPQLKYYGLGAVNVLPPDAVKHVVLTIVQPRCQHPDGPVRHDIKGIEDLLVWASELVEAAKRTEQPNAPLNAGDHCKFCPAAGTCPALRGRALDRAQAEFDEEGKLELPQPTTMGHNSLAAVLADIDLIEDWCHSVRQHAHAMALAGQVPPGFKLVRSRPSRKWKDEKRTVDALALLGFEGEELFTKKFMSPAQAEKLLPAKLRPTLGELIEQVSGKTVLAKESDPRPPVKSDAGDEFGEG